MKVLSAFFLCFILLTGCSHITRHQGAELDLGNSGTPRGTAPTAENNVQQHTQQRQQYRFGAPLVTQNLCQRQDQTAAPLAANLDADHDGISDQRDECPATPDHLAVDSTGCPLSLFLSLRLPYQSNQTTVNENQAFQIRQVATLLKHNPHSRITLTGHTDNSGNTLNNQAISIQRAEEIKKTLIQNYQITPQRITTKGLGDSKPLVSNATESGRERNRRVDISITGYYSSHTSAVALYRPYRLHFEANQTDPSAALLPRLKALGAYLQQHPEVVAHINGYTDSRGNARQNLALSVLRAEKIKLYLTQQYGITPDRLQAHGFGQNNPVADNATEQGRGLNRRVTIRLSTPGVQKTASNRFKLPLHARIDTSSTPLARRDIPFAPQNAQLETHSKQAIDEIGTLMRSKPDMRIVIEGHASGLPDAENRRISQARAQHVKQYLQDRYNIDANRLRAIGYGNDLAHTANASQGANRVHIRLDRF